VQVATHTGDAGPDEAQNGIDPVQAFVHAPQVAGWLKFASHPSIASPLQSAYPGAHDVVAITHLPPVQLVGPLTWGRFVQSLVQLPHVAGFVASVAHPLPAFAQSR
jgi:hypothetical protein